jgi:hypothetical protein
MGQQRTCWRFSSAAVQSTCNAILKLKRAHTALPRRVVASKHPAICRGSLAKFCDYDATFLVCLTGPRSITSAA